MYLQTTLPRAARCLLTQYFGDRSQTGQKLLTDLQNFSLTDELYLFFLVA